MIKISKILISVLLFYLIWYVEAIGNLRIILYGTTILSVICVFVDLVCKGSLFSGDYPYTIWFQFIMIIYCFFTSVFVSENIESALSATITYLAYCMVCFVITYITIEEQSIEWLTNIISMISLFCCYWVMFHGVIEPGYGKVLGWNNNPNTLGVIMVLGVFSLLYKSQGVSLKSYLNFAISIWPIYTIVGCGSRKSLIAACILMSLWFFIVTIEVINSNDFTKLSIHIFVTFIISIVVIGFIIPYYLEADMADRMSHFSNENSNTFRLLLYRRAGELFLENPIWGVGLNQYVYRAGLSHMAHSTYAEAIADFGFIGTLIYSVPIIGTIIEAISRLLNGRFVYRDALIFSLICTEMFLAVGQVFFFDPIHFVAWSIIYCYFYITNNRVEKDIINIKRACKYVKVKYRN